MTGSNITLKTKYNEILNRWGSWGKIQILHITVGCQKRTDKKQKMYLIGSGVVEYYLERASHELNKL